MATKSEHGGYFQGDVGIGPKIFGNKIVFLSVGVVAAASFIWMYWHGILGFMEAWTRDEYSHGPIIPLIAVFLIARQLSTSEPVKPKGLWLSVGIAFLAVVAGVLGTLSNIADLTQYGLILGLLAVMVAVFGRSQTIALWAPIIYLVFMIPLPQILYLKLFSWAQLISSLYGTYLVRFVGIPVFLEGNIIDLGNYKLQVVEACSGLRYLFPLMSFGFLFSVLFQGNKLEKAFLFLSTIPISIVMNSMRIGVIGILVHNFGIEQAEGFLHLSEGWVVFVACLAILYAEASVLTLFHSSTGSSKLSSLDLGFERLGQVLPKLKNIRDFRPLMAVTGLFIVGLVTLSLMQNQASKIPERDSFVTFPNTIGSWSGRRATLASNIERVLGADDYLSSTYTSKEVAQPVNLFVAYYKTQNKGNAVHSPEVCIPGAGWEISRLETKRVDLGEAGGEITIKRAIIQKGTARDLVYYWFKERGRTISNEWAAKWFIFVDSVTQNRTDGSIIRLVTPITGEGEEASDDRLREFMKLSWPKLSPHLPS